MDTSAFPLVATSKLCLAALNSLSSSLEAAGNEHKSLMPPQTLQNQRDRFKIWAGNLGALQEGRASLDFRLRESILMQSAVHKLLKQLEDTIKRSSDVVLGVRKPLEESLASADEEEDLWGDSSDDDSSSDDQEGINTRTELGQNTVAMVQILSDLFKLSFKIRNPTTGSAALKPLLFKQMVHVDDTTVDLLAHFAPFDRSHVEEELRELQRSVQGRPRLIDVYPAPESLDNINTGETSPPPSANSDDLEVEPEDEPRNFLVERWGKSLTNRRRFFAYWKNHAQKLAKIASDDYVDSEEPGRTEVQSPSPMPTTGPVTILVARAGAGPSHAGKTILSGAEGSTDDPRLDDETDTHSVVSYASTTYGIDGTVADLPRPPQVKPFQKEFQCPYCWVTCPARHARGKSWREHILRDLQPYMCTYDECSDPDAMYSSRAAWLTHEADAHRRVWRCFAHAGPLYSSQGALKQHLVAEHGAVLGPAQIQELSKSSHASTVDQRSTCPFCQSTGPFKKGLENHMAFHMEQLACFALSRSSCVADDTSSGGDNTNTAQAARSDASLASDSLVFSDTSYMNGDEMASHRGRINSVAFSPDGKMLASASDDTKVILWHVVTGAHKYTLEGHISAVNSVAFSSDGKTLASASFDCTIRLWEIATGVCKQVLKDHMYVVMAVAFSPDGITLASASHDETIRIWVKGVHQQTLKGHGGWVNGVTFSPDGKTLASASKNKIWLWDMKTGVHPRLLEGHSKVVISIAFSPDGMTLASTSGHSTIRLWDLKTGMHLRTLRGHIFAVSSVTFSPDGMTLATASEDTTVQLWDLNKVGHRRVLWGHSGNVRSVTFSPDGKTLASASHDWTAKMWDPDSGECLQTLGVSKISTLMSSITKALAATKKDYRTIKDDKNLPEVFHAAVRDLMLVSEALNTAKAALKDDMPASPGILTQILENFEKRAISWQNTLRQVACGPEETSRFEEYRTAVRNRGGDGRVEVLVEGMMTNVCELSMVGVLGVDSELEMVMEPHVEKLHAAMDRLSVMEPSLPDEEFV